ncbi:MAG: PAS domain S-box protein [Desulfobacterales bacterium]|nr:PAS domain S-box protein [Desulfobacterales bacterium]
MNTSTIIGMVNNAALLLTLGLLYDMVGYKPQGRKPSIQQAGIGVILGAIGIAVMLTPWQFTPGVVFDTRSVLLSVSGLFFGVIPTLAATLMTGALRLYNGGAGVWTGVGVIITSGAIGVAWRHFRVRKSADISIRELYFMGLVVHIAMLLWMFTLPWSIALSVLSNISLPVMVIYPVGTALLGKLMVNLGARKLMEEELKFSTQQLKANNQQLIAGEQELKKEKEFSDKIVKTSSAVIVGLNKDHLIRIFNKGAEKITGRTMAEVIDKDWFEIFFPPERLEEMNKVWKDAWGISSHYYINSILSKTGEEKIISWQTTGIYEDKDDRKHLLISIGEDITERKKAEDELKKHRDHLEELVKERTEEIEEKTTKLEKSQNSLTLLLEDVNESRAELDRSNKNLEAANRELEAFSYSVSHDLRTPLRTIDGFSQILLEDYSDVLDKKAIHYLNRVRVGTQNMGRLIDNLLNLSRIGRQEMIKKDLRIENIAEKVYRSLKQERKDRKIKFSVNKCPPVLADPDLLQIVLINLISNALKFTRNKKIAEIEIGAQTQDNQAVFYVKDNGVGFDMKYVDKLFSPFQRLHHESEFEGTGIGLAIAQRIIARHGGKIRVDSAPDKGTIFYLTLKET